MAEAARLLQFPNRKLQAATIEEQEAEKLLDSLAPNTARKYRAYWQQFNEWHGQELTTETDSREADKLLAGWARHLHDEGKAPSSVSIMGASVKWHYRYVLEIAPSYKFWNLAIKSLNREGRERGRGQRDGLTWADVEAMAKAAEDGKGILALRDAAMLRVMSDGSLRSAEVCGIKVEHIERIPDGTNGVPDGSANLLIVKSKTDQSGKGAYAPLGPPTVEALDRWIKAAGIVAGHVFVSTHGRKSTIGQPIQTRTVYNVVRKLARDAGIEKRIGSHSLRIGSTQELARRGASDAELMASGRWNNVSQAAHYARADRAEQAPTMRYKYGV